MALNPDGPAMRPAERRRLFPRSRQTKASGYFDEPGTGPEGETCKTCKHLLRHGRARIYHKCDRTNWTFGPATDIRTRSPACRGWENGNG